jgi:hypothetical protein
MNNLTKLVDKIIREVKQTDSCFVSLYDKVLPLYPLPFFGDLENAEVITIAVNPSPTEFKSERGWICGLTPEQLTYRLVTYFTRFPHKWFLYVEEIDLIPEGNSFFRNAAHIDLSPRPTKIMRNFRTDPNLWKKFQEMLLHDARKWLLDLLAIPKNLKKVHLLHRVPATETKITQPLELFVRSQLTEVWDFLVNKGLLPKFTK